MSDEQTWDDSTREELRDNLRMRIRGEVRLAKRDRENVLDLCRDVYIVDECPENEQADFIRCAAEELDRAERQLESEQAGWPVETDCDRLDRVEATLRGRGILLWQASPCCDTCTVSELTDRVDQIESSHPGFCAIVRGYAFFIDQNLPEMLAESSELSLYLGYGWFLPGDTEVPPAEYEKHALGIAREVCECLRDEAFEVDWDGSLRRKLLISVNWQRRTLRE